MGFVSDVFHKPLNDVYAIRTKEYIFSHWSAVLVCIPAALSL